MSIALVSSIDQDRKENWIKKYELPVTNNYSTLKSLVESGEIENHEKIIVLNDGYGLTEFTFTLLKRIENLDVKELILICMNEDFSTSLISFKDEHKVDFLKIMYYERFKVSDLVEVCKPPVEEIITEEVEEILEETVIIDDTKEIDEKRAEINEILENKEISVTVEEVVEELKEKVRSLVPVDPNSTRIVELVCDKPTLNTNAVLESVISILDFDSIPFHLITDNKFLVEKFITSGAIEVETNVFVKGKSIISLVLLDHKNSKINSLEKLNIHDLAYMDEIVEDSIVCNVDAYNRFTRNLSNSITVNSFALTLLMKSNYEKVFYPHLPEVSRDKVKEYISPVISKVVGR
jgi:hypothetical protein